MEIAICGLAKSGKTTVFGALARVRADPATHAPSVGVVKVPDPRLELLSHLLKPKRTIPSEVRYIDIPTPAKEWVEGQFLSQLSKADALIQVVRAFEDERVPHLDGSVDPQRDIKTFALELAFSDLAIIERRSERLVTSLKGAKPQEREGILREQALLSKIKSALDEEVPVREQGLSAEEARSIENYQFLTAKPLLLVVNIGEEQLPEAGLLEERWRQPRCPVAALCGKLEMELAELSPSDAEEFRSALGLSESGLDRVIRLSYELLGLLTFFTIASDEVKAWTVRRDTTAQRAAGKIHSDMERGFIRAEVVRHDDLLRCGSMAEARKRGLVHLEGKNYLVQDGDVLTILFHV